MDDELDLRPKYAPILPYNSTIGEKFVSYDNTKYIQDKALSDVNPIAKFSGNVLRFYRVNIESPKPVGGDIQ